MVGLPFGEGQINGGADKSGGIVRRDGHIHRPFPAVGGAKGQPGAALGAGGKGIALALGHILILAFPIALKGQLEDAAFPGGQG